MKEECYHLLESRYTEEERLGCGCLPLEAVVPGSTAVSIFNIASIADESYHGDCICPVWRSTRNEW